jgi:hypothetical protein
VSASFTDLALCDVKLRVPSDKAAASELDVEAEVDGRSGSEVEVWERRVAEPVL